MARETGCEVTKEYQPLVWRGAFTDGELDKALPPSAYWHEHAFSDYGQLLYLISVSPVGVELVAHDGRQGVWQPGLAHFPLLDRLEVEHRSGRHRRSRPGPTRQRWWSHPSVTPLWC